MTNSDLNAAREAKKDEFYTNLIDIQTEIENYPGKFRDKIVFCNCDDLFNSNFVKYFLMNFNRLGLKELIVSGYRVNSLDKTAYALRVKDTSKCLVDAQEDLSLTGVEHFLHTEGNRIKIPLVGNTALDKDGNQIQFSVKESIIGEDGFLILNKNGKPKTKLVKHDLYYKAGDFRSDMSIALLKESDIIVTNPPFSLFREFVALLMEYKKQFLIIGTINSATYKGVFSLIRSNEIWFGSSMSSGDRRFYVPDDYPLEGSDCGIDENNRRFIKVKGIRWFTNIDHEKRHQKLPLSLECLYKDHENMYPEFDRYEAINVDRTSQIPCDYEGVMGVPVTFIDKYCPEQFDIIAFRKKEDGKHLAFTRDMEIDFNLIFTALYDKYYKNGNGHYGKYENHLRSYHSCKEKGIDVEPIDLIYPAVPATILLTSTNSRTNGSAKYVRILIRKKT